MMKITVFGTNCKAAAICRVLPDHPKKKNPLGYGGIENVEKYFINQNRFKPFVKTVLTFI